MLFDSHFALPFPLNAMSTGDQLSSENDLIENNAEVCLSGKHSPQPDSQTRAALKAQKAWSKNSTHSIQQVDIWHEVRSASVVNIFHSQDTPRNSFQIDDIASDFTQGSEINLKDTTKERLKALKRNILTCDCSNLFDRDSICDKGYLCQNTTEVFDQGLYLYTHKYQPAYPIAHLATLNPEKVPDILLFVMCMIGISLLKTEDAIAFIRTTYPVRMIFYECVSS